MKKILAESVDNTGEFAASPAAKDYKELAAEVDRLKREDRGESEYSDDFFRNVEMLVRYGPFRRLGKGSSRTAYSFDADPRYVLKFAHNDNGVRQSRTEIKNAKAGSGDYSCMVRILDYDPDGIFIIEDRCVESTYADWYRIIGIGPNTLSKIVRVVFDRKKTDPEFTLRDLLEEIRDPRTAAKILKKTSPMDDEYLSKDHPKIIACVENMLAAADGKTQEPKWVALYDLFRFYCDNGLSAMIPEELLYIDQWGIRQGSSPEHDALIIIDPGVDDDFRPFAGKSGRVR